MAKQVILEKGLTKSGHIDCHEGGFCSVTQAVDDLSQHLFAGSGLPANEHIVIGGGNSLSLVKDEGHCFILGHHTSKGRPVLEI